MLDNPHTALAKYNAACRAVAHTVTVDEAKEPRDKGEAMRAYAKQAKNKNLEVQAAEIRIRAERRFPEGYATHSRKRWSLSSGILQP